MRAPILIFFVPVTFWCVLVAAEQQPAVVCSIKPGDLVEYEHESPAVKNLIETSLALTCRNLGYTYGSDSPTSGGMDCSGTIGYVLKSAKIRGVPRSSYTIYHWANENGALNRMDGGFKIEDPTLRRLKPGDLVFWEGTYAVKDRNPPISHVMLYLGTLKKDGKGVLFGASSGRSYRGTRIHGVSVFDFKVPSATSTSKLVAFGPVPGLRSPKKAEEVAPSREANEPTAPQAPAPANSKTRSNRPPSNLVEKLQQFRGSKKPFGNIFSKKK